MSRLSRVSKPDAHANTVCFDLLFQGARCGSSWARLLPAPSGGWEVVCRQVMFDVDAIGLRKSRRQSRHAFSLDGVLVAADVWDHQGNRVSLSMEDGAIHASGQSRPLAEPVTWVLEQNMAALSVRLLEHMVPARKRTFHALAPETGTCMPYVLTPSPEGYQSNLGETFNRDEQGWVKTVSTASPDFMFVRVKRRFPAWSLEGIEPVFHYRPPPSIRAEDVHVAMSPGADGLRDATLAQPKAASDLSAAGVFIGGTGVYDRHGFTSAFDIGYHQLLDDLAGEGVATLRYEKFAPTAVSLEEAEGSQDFTALGRQAQAALSWLDTRNDLKRIPRIAVGHSLGGLVALSLVEHGVEPDGLVLLNTPGRSFRAVTQGQLDWFSREAATSSESDTASQSLREMLIAALESKTDWTAETVDPRILPHKRKRKLYKEILDLDPCDLVWRGSCPVLIVQGGADVQVSLDDARRLAAACREAERPHHLLEAKDLDHLLKRNKERGLKALRVYRDRRRRVPIALIRIIAAAVKAWDGKREVSQRIKESM